VKYFARIGSREYEIEVDNNQIWLDGEAIEVDLQQGGVPALYSLIFNHQSHELLITADRFNYTVSLQGEQFQVQVEDERTRRLNARRKPAAAAAGELAIVAPIPGLVVKVLVNEGDKVVEDQPLVILEAMKMENELRAVRDGVIKQVKVVAGQRVEQNALLILLD
jgi:biotin carboxyl carrier protein